MYNFRCYSKTMARYLEANECKLLKHYYSSVDEAEIFEFDGSERTWDIARAYNRRYNEWLQNQQN